MSTVLVVVIVGVDIAAMAGATQGRKPATPAARPEREPLGRHHRTVP